VMIITVLSVALEYKCPDCDAEPGYDCSSRLAPHISRLYLASKTPKVVEAMVEVLMYSPQLRDCKFSTLDKRCDI